MSGYEAIKRTAIHRKERMSELAELVQKLYEKIRDRDERVAKLEAALRDVLSCRGSSIAAIMDNSDAAKERARQLLKEASG